MAKAAVFGVLLLCGVACAAASAPFQWQNLQPNAGAAFNTTGVTMTSNTGTWEEGANATIVLTGDVFRELVGGHVIMSLWEYGIEEPTFKKNFDYCYCHGYPKVVCDACKPIDLVYNNCKDASTFTMTMNYIMPAAQLTGNYTATLLSGHYYPKEIVVDVYYKYNN